MNIFDNIDYESTSILVITVKDFKEGFVQKMMKFPGLLEAKDGI